MPTCRPGSSVLDGLQPGDKRNTAKVAKDTSIAAGGVNRFAALDTSDSGLGPQAIAPGPRAGTSPCHCPSQTHRQLSTLYHSDRTAVQ
jgi:hypothetical protein